MDTSAGSLSRSGSRQSLAGSRRTSFSRNVSATIDQFRTALDDAKRESASTTAPSLSPRKTMSLQQLIPPNRSSSARNHTLDLGADFAQRQQQQQRADAAVHGAVAHVSVDSDDSDDDNEDVREIDLAVDSFVYSDASSSSSQASSPANRGAVAVTFSDQAHVKPVSIVTTATTNNVVGTPAGQQDRAVLFSDDDLPDWLQDRPVFAPYSQTSVQHIEDDIRHALDSAANRVRDETERRDCFEHELRSAASRPVAVAYSYDPTSSSVDVLDDFDRALSFDLSPPPRESLALPVAPAHPELLLLMEVVIGEGRSETIEVHVGDEPHVLAAQFAHQHALQLESVPKLAQLIRDQLDALSLDDLGLFEDAPIATSAASTTQYQSEQFEFMQPPPAPIATSYSSSPPQQQHLHEQVESPRYLPNYLEPSLSSTTYETNPDRAAASLPPAAPVTAIDSDVDKQEREYSRAMNYQNLMAKYGHYNQHSGKVDPTVAAASGAAAAGGGSRQPGGTRTNNSGGGTMMRHEKNPLTFRNVQLAEHTRESRRHTLNSSGNRMSATPATAKHKDKAPAVFDRLHALAESKDKWIRRAQNAKQRELEHEQSQRKVAMAAKSRDLLAHRTSGGYAHIGERLYDEALSDIAKKDRLRKQRAAERETQIDWMCPKCAFVNQHNDDVCKNVTAASFVGGTSSNSSSSSSNVDDVRARTRRDSVGGYLDAGFESFCGQLKPEQLFRPTLLASSASVVSAVGQNKERAARLASIRRERNQQAIEDEFRQTCPFKPTINEVSAEIVRERLENNARAASVGGSAPASGDLRRKDPHLALYEDSFTVRANRQAREDEYMQQYSFKPDIGVNALWVSSNVDGSAREDVVERLAVSKYHELEAKRQALHDKYAPDRDPDTGRAYFTPETGRAPAFNRNERKLPIGDFLHASHREQQEFHRRLLQQSMHELQQKQRQGFVSDASRQALVMRKAKTFRRLFDALLKVSVADTAQGSRDATSASGDNGVTSAPSSPSKSLAVVTPSLVQLDLLPREVAQVVPIVFALANNAPFTCAQFSGFMDKLMVDVPGFTYTQVLFLAEHLSDGQSSRVSASKHASAHSGASGNDDDDESAQLTFRPTIDKNSDAIAKKHGRADRSKVFDALNQYFEHYKSRKAQVEKQQQRDFDRLHPFQPHMVAKKSKRLAAGFYDKIAAQQQEQEAQAAAATRTGAGQQQPHDVTSDTSPPLRTALANVRPCVRPIDGSAADMALTMSTRGSSSSLSSLHGDDMGMLAESDDEADLTSRVLAALDELPSSSHAASMTSSLQSASSASRHSKTMSATTGRGDAELLRSPEAT